MSLYWLWSRYKVFLITSFAKGQVTHICWWSLKGLPLWNWVGCASSSLTADKNFHDSWFCPWFAILHWNLSGGHPIEQLYLLNTSFFSCQPVLLLLLLWLFVQSRRISAFYTENSELILPKPFALVDYSSWIKSWVAYIHPILYQPEELNLIWERFFRRMWET